MSKGLASGARGISLIEALVALAVMAFGMLGVVGLQSTLRFNSDVSKQRSEAVRMVQEITDSRRNFSTISSMAGRSAFDSIVSRPNGDIVGTNATFTLTESATADTEALPMKTLSIGATWQDRTSQTQGVQVTTVVSRSSPEIGAALVAPAGGGTAQRPNGRSAAIPRGATDLGNGKSEFVPPTLGSPYKFVFNNATGVIEQVCVTSPSLSCTTNYGLLAGFIQFATGATQPTAADAAIPSSLAVDVDISVDTVGSLCFRDQASPGATFLQYFCAVPLDGTGKWSGSSLFSGVPIPTSTLSPDNVSASSYRVCRYTPNSSGATSSNTEHPAAYVNVGAALTNQNYLLIRAGDGTVAFSCPGDDSALPGNTNTYPYQPAP